MAEIKLQKSKLLWSSFPIDNLTPIKCVLYGRWSVISILVLRNLSDKLYEKRKNAALKVEGMVNQLPQLEIMIKLMWRLNFWSMNLLIHFQQSMRKMVDRIGSSYSGFFFQKHHNGLRFVTSIYAIICHGDKKVRNEISKKHIPKQ